MTLRTHLWSQLVVMLCAILAGCADRHDVNVPHALWDPGYLQCGLLTPSEGLRDWLAAANTGLQQRLGDPKFWQLAELIIKHSAEADHLILVERIPREELSDYWFCLLVLRGNAVFCYAHEFWPNGCDLWPEFGTDLARRLDGVPPAWGRLESGQAALELIDFVYDHGVVRRDLSLRCAPRKLSFTHPAPWFIHVYRRRGNLRADYAVNRPMLDLPVIVGGRSLAEVNCTMPITAEELFAPTSSSDKAGTGAEQDDYLESYAARVILNGLLKVLYEARLRK